MAARGDNRNHVFDSIWYVIFPAPWHLHRRTDHPSVQDTLAFLIILYSVKWRGTTHGVSSILNKIFRDATTYFIVIFTSHLLQVLFESFAPVSDFPTYLSSSAPDELHTANDSTASGEVSHGL